MNKKLEDNTTKYPNSIDTRVALLEASISHVNDTLVRLEKKFDKIDDQFNEVKKEMRYDFKFLLTAIAGLAAVMAHGFHWF
jgi:predicted nuclease with TOPRIM domain